MDSRAFLPTPSRDVLISRRFPVNRTWRWVASNFVPNPRAMGFTQSETADDEGHRRHSDRVVEPSIDFAGSRANREPDQRYEPPKDAVAYVVWQ